MNENKRNNKSKGNLAENIVCTIIVLLIVWFILSFIDVNMNNNAWDSHNYSTWNIFAIIFN